MSSASRARSKSQYRCLVFLSFNTHLFLVDRLFTIVFLILVGSSIPLLAVAQQPADSIRKAAMKDYHGSDLEGKDGPLAKAGLDLLVLYHEYRAHRADKGTASRIQSEDTKKEFTPSGQGIRVSNGRVTIEAIATTDVDSLLQDLEALGLSNGATAGGVVSGRMPISKIPSMAKLGSLQSVSPAQMQTRSDRGGTTSSPNPPADTGAPSEEQPPPSADTAQVRSADADTVAREDPPASEMDGDTAGTEVPSSDVRGDTTAIETSASDTDDGGSNTGLILGVVSVLAGLLLGFVIWWR
jgi:hypothetical protein